MWENEHQYSGTNIFVHSFIDLYALQPLKNDEDLTNMFQFSDRFARVYICLASIVEGDEIVENGEQG